MSVNCSRRLTGMQFFSFKCFSLCIFGLLVRLSSNLHMALLTWKKWQNGKILPSEDSITPVCLCLWAGFICEMLEHLPCRNCWCFSGAIGTRPIQPASPRKRALADSSSLCTSFCHHKQKRKLFLKSRIRKEMACPALARARLNTGIMQR